MTAMSQRLPRLAAMVGLAAHVAFFVWYAASLLLAPLWAVAGLLAIWTGLLVAAVRWWRRPLLILMLPVIDAAVWFAVISAGGYFLGWTA